MRVMHVVPGIDRGGGVEESLRGLAPLLRRRGIDLELGVVHDRRDLADDLEGEGLVVHQLRPARTTVGRALAVVDLAERIRPDLVHASLHDAVVPTQLAARRLGAPVLVTWSTTPPERGRRDLPRLQATKLAVIRTIERAGAGWSRCHFQAVTPGVAEAYREHLRVAPERVHVSGRGRPVPARRGPEVRERVRRELGCTASDRVVLAVARHDERKGLDRLIAAMADVVAALPDAHLFVAGQRGPITSSLVAAAARAGVDRNVHLLGHCDHVDDLLCAADVVVSASTVEGAAGAVIEAMAAGRPIVATPVVGLRGILDDGGNALVTDAAATGLAGAILRVLDDQALAARLAQGAAATHRARFTLERSADDLARLYWDLRPDLS